MQRLVCCLTKCLDQGFLSRLLVASPASTAGTRFQRELRPETEPALRRYGARLSDILETPPILMAGARNALDPRRLEFDDEAKKLTGGTVRFIPRKSKIRKHPCEFCESCEFTFTPRPKFAAF
jgi:hypothetical protein